MFSHVTNFQRSGYFYGCIFISKKRMKFIGCMLNSSTTTSKCNLHGLNVRDKQNSCALNTQQGGNMRITSLIIIIIIIIRLSRNFRLLTWYASLCVQRNLPFKKSLDTFGDFQWPVFSLGVSQNVCIKLKSVKILT